MKKLILPLLLILGGTLFSQSIDVNLKADKTTSPIKHVRFLNNNKIAYCRNYSEAIRVIDLSKLTISSYWDLKGRPEGFEFSNNRKFMIGTMIEGDMGMWNARNGKLLYRIEEKAEYYSGPRSLAFTPDNKHFQAFNSCDLISYAIRSGEKVDSISPLESDCMYRGVFTKDMKRFYTGGNDSLWVYARESQNVIAKIETNALSVITDVAISPDEKMIAYSGRSGLWIVAPDLSLIFDLKGEKGWIREIAFSHDGKYLFSCSGSFKSNDYAIRIWSTETGKCEKVFTQNESVNSIDVSPDGKWLISGHDDRSMKIWDIGDRKLVATIIPMIATHGFSERFLIYTA